MFSDLNMLSNIRMAKHAVVYTAIYGSNINTHANTNNFFQIIFLYFHLIIMGTLRMESTKALSASKFFNCTYFNNVSMHTKHTLIHHSTGTEENVSEKRKVFKEDLKELTEVSCETNTGSWFQVAGAW